MDDVIDYTPAIKAAALAELSKYKFGPMYTPPSLQGTVVRPGAIAAATSIGMTRHEGLCHA